VWQAAVVCHYWRWLNTLSPYVRKWSTYCYRKNEESGIQMFCDATLGTALVLYKPSVYFCTKKLTFYWPILIYPFAHAVGIKLILFNLIWNRSPRRVSPLVLFEKTNVVAGGIERSRLQGLLNTKSEGDSSSRGYEADIEEGDTLPVSQVVSRNDKKKIKLDRKRSRENFSPTYTVDDVTNHVESMWFCLRDIVLWSYVIKCCFRWQ